MAKNNQAQAVLLGTDALPAQVPLAEGVVVQLGDVVGRAFEDSKLDVEAWNGLSVEDRDAAILGARDALAAEAAAPPVEKGKKVECVVLYDSIYGKHDEIIKLGAAAAKAAAEAGYVDPHPNAIKAIRDAAKPVREQD